MTSAETSKKSKGKKIFTDLVFTITLWNKIFDIKEKSLLTSLRIELLIINMFKVGFFLHIWFGDPKDKCLRGKMEDFCPIMFVLFTTSRQSGVPYTWAGLG